MIKLFRTLRTSIFKDAKSNNTVSAISKYIIFALVEVALVVVGILVAIWLNDLQEASIKRAQEKETLQQLKVEFQANLKQLNDKISMRNSMIKASSRLLQYHDSPETMVEDSVVIFLARTSVSPTFDPITNDLISGGRLYLISNPQLRSKLSKWPSDLVQVTEEEVAWIFILRQSYMPFLYANYPVRNINAAKWNKLDVVQTLLLDKKNMTTDVIGKSTAKFDTFKFITNPKLADQLSSVFSSCLFAKTQSEALGKSIKEILTLIEMELQE